MTYMCEYHGEEGTGDTNSRGEAGGSGAQSRGGDGRLLGGGEDWGGGVKQRPQLSNVHQSRTRFYSEEQNVAFGSVVLMIN